MAIASCAATYSVITKRKIFSTLEIDSILLTGDKFYQNIISGLRQRHQYIDAHLNYDDLPVDIPVKNFIAQQDDSKTFIPLNGYLNPDFEISVENLNEKLINLFAKNNDNEIIHDDDKDNYLFTCQQNTVSFWRNENKFYLFNSHDVDETNRYTGLNPKARLFQCENERSLARLLLIGRSFDFIVSDRINTHRAYCIDKLRIIKINIDNQQNQPIVVLQKLDLSKIDVNVTNFKNNDSKFNDTKNLQNQPIVVLQKLDFSKVDVHVTNLKNYDPKLTILKPTVILDRIDQNIPLNRITNNKSETSRKVGRPKKIVRGRKRVKENAHADAVKKYANKMPQINVAAVKKYIKENPQVNRTAVNKYSRVHPEVNRAAVDKYSQSHPEVHRAAVDKYSQSHPDVNQKATQKYNSGNRHIEPELRASSELIGEKRGDSLNTVKLFTLKNPSLVSNTIIICQFCNTPLFHEEKERKQWCCGKGEYNVQNLEPLSEDFYYQESFLIRPRIYNNLFAFSALGAKYDHLVEQELRRGEPIRGLFFLKVLGRVYHQVYNLSANTKLGSYYINDNFERERYQAGVTLNLNMEVMRCITNFLHNVNPYIECFKRLHRETSENAHLIFKHVSRPTDGNILGDLPIGNEVAAIIRSDDEPFVPHSIAIWKIGDSNPHFVDILNPIYECFQYPLLYPHGNPGWHPDKKTVSGDKLTQTKYVRCLLLSEPRFSKLSRLSEEWIIDMFNRISEEKLRYLEIAQKRNTLRSAPLNEVVGDESIQGEGGVVPGKVYLPYSFTGGPRYMKLKYFDSVALLNRLGHPSFFVTMTCNPKWPEIVNSVPSGQKPDPLICARVFNLKLTQLIEDIRAGKWFGKNVYFMYVIEFQKRGLPHAHICFRVEGGGPVTNLEIDKFVRADIPDPSEAGGRLRKLVLDHMVHGPCGVGHRTDIPCVDKDTKKCTKYFPKPETDTTFTDNKGFVNLKRNSKNEGTITYNRKSIVVNDLWIVPYNAALLLKYDCHLNVEVSTASTVVKYLFKYITKGADHSRVALATELESNNEIQNYVTKRYLGSCEATWRILEFPIVRRDPNVKQLVVHLENQQTVYFRMDNNENVAVNNRNSDLITYFNRPIGPEFDNLTYADFYEKYNVHASRNDCPKTTEIFETGNNKFVTKRLRGSLVARLFFVAPNRGEQFFLRILLASYPCRSYRDLLNLGGPSCNTFQEAAKAVGLADDEVEYERAMSEACNTFVGPRLRSFFVLLAVNGIPVASLWSQFREQISEDFIRRQLDGNLDRAYNLCLIAIDRLLRKHGTCLVEQGLPDVVDETTELGRERVEYDTTRLQSFVTEWLPQLSREQNEIFTYVTELVSNREFRDQNETAIFVDGPGGTGKTLLLNVLAAHVRSNLGGVVLCTASSGIAAQNYENGTTAHSMFKFPLNLLDDHGYWNITNGSQRANLILNADVIIFDEAPMAHKWLIHLLDRSLRDLMQSNKLFGGKIIIFAGDYRQIPPVVVGAKTNEDILNASVKSSPIWQNLKTFSLVTSQRCRSDNEYSDFILKLGSNQISPQANESNLNLINLSIISFVIGLDDLIDFVFPHVVMDEPDVCIHRAILTTHNESVRNINEKILERLPEDLLHFYSIDKPVSDDADQIILGIDALNQLRPKGIPEYDLKLKVGCVCMIIRNLNFSAKLVNGTKVIVVATSPRLITVRRSGVIEDTEDHLIPRILFKAPIAPNSPIEMYRRQFPLQVCYAMTIHKSQGQTISRAGVDLRSDVFSHGQLYVALSRVENRENIRILINRSRVNNGDPLANNVVYPPLL